MSKYGHTFDTKFDPAKTDIYRLISSIYRNTKLTKVRDDEKNSVYMGRTVCMLINECRYLIATVDKNNDQVGTQKELDQLEWTNFQTRTLKGKFKCESCSVADTSIESPHLELDTRNQQYTQYKNTTYGIKVALLHTKTNNLFEYPNHGDLISALELYQTVISF